VVAINLKSFHVVAAKVIFIFGIKKGFFEFYGFRLLKEPFSPSSKLVGGGFSQPFATRERFSEKQSLTTNRNSLHP
jgi:hypothetical protein